jgi:superfamily I DNA/RNA helicase
MESVERILSLIHAAITSRDVSQKDIVVITAFRKQANIIRARLRELTLKFIKVDTVHRLQGSEAPIVIFDPVDGLHDLLMNEKGRQLINVALSRAQAKLILMLSERDLQNPTFSKVLEIVQQHSNRPVSPVAQVLSDPNHLTTAIGKRVDIGGQVAEITRFSRDGAMMWADMESTGHEAYFDTYRLL